MESYVASNITNHVVTQNLLDDRQWAYKKGKSASQDFFQAFFFRNYISCVS